MLENKTSLIEIAASIDELIQAMKANPFGADHADLVAGRKTVDVFSDRSKIAQLLDGTPYLLAKQKCLRRAIEDLAGGGAMLMKSALGVRLVHSVPEVFAQGVEIKKPLEGVLFRVQLKDAAAFRDVNEKSDLEIHEQTAHAAMYYLIYLLATVEIAS